jgi:uncharacterized membrane protein YgdD (TMEM256/DUF423 family)
MSNTNIQSQRIAAIVGFIGVVLGAFGAHGLHGLLEKNNALEIWKTASTYHLIHAVVLLFVANQRPLPRLAWILFLAGIMVFSGSLYLLAVTNVRWLGAITPLGGLAFLAGWLWLAIRPFGTER